MHKEQKHAMWFVCPANLHISTSIIWSDVTTFHIWTKKGSNSLRIFFLVCLSVSFGNIPSVEGNTAAQFTSFASEKGLFCFHPVWLFEVKWINNSDSRYRNPELCSPYQATLPLVCSPKSPWILWPGFSRTGSCYLYHVYLTDWWLGQAH